MRKVSLTVASLAMISVLAGCGGGSTTDVQNPQGPGPSNVAVAFDPAPPGTVFINETTTLTAVVSNDSSEAGVDWSLTCPSDTCGSLTPVHTASGAASTYTPPLTLPGNSETVNIVAFATTDHTKNALAPVRVTAFGSNLQGTYIFQTRGTDSFGAFQFVGAVVLDGNGVITSGEQIYTSPVQSVTDAITGGTYFIGPDGRGSLIFTTANQTLGQSGVETFSLVYLSNSQVFLTQMDDANDPVASNETSSGTLDLQISRAALSGGYAFAVHGTDVASVSSTGMGGVLNVDSPKTISGTGSVIDRDVFGAVDSSQTLSGTVSDPDGFGKVKFELSAGFTSAPMELTGYIVDATHIKLIETDNSLGNGLGSTSGVAIGQGAATGTFHTDSAFAGNFVFGVLGEDFSGLSASLASVGVFTADGTGNLTDGFNDAFLGGLFSRVRDQFTGTYSVDASGTGRVDSVLTFHQHHAPGPELIFYLTGSGNPPLVLNIDGSLGAVGTGLAYAQAAAPISFNGRYGISMVQSSFGSEIDSSGQITVDGTASTLSGVVDTNFFFSPVPNTPITGTFDAIPDNGRMPGTLSNELYFLPTMGVEYYLIDSGHGFVMDTDSINSGELTLGYFSTRTPVCDGCP